ncbi:xylanase [Tannerella sp. oral taxon 808]|nr:xylanase [Tannerella sp. oral taxon 808]
MKRVAALLLCALLSITAGRADDWEGNLTFSTEDVAAFEACMQSVRNAAPQTVGDATLAAARHFVGRPYVAATLEKDPERLVVNLREWDCTTLVESAVALARTARSEAPSFATYLHELSRLRYRSDTINDYTDRLHYFTDWIYENTRRGLVRDMTAALGGRPYRPRLSFMSTHPDRYAALRNHPWRVAFMRDKEAAISARTGYAVLPTASIPAAAASLRDGDIVCFVTDIPGLDISHVGIICRRGRTVTFIHASSAAGRVIVEPTSLHAYATRNPRTLGVMILRPL